MLVIGERVASTLLFAAANTPRALASVYAAEALLLKNTLSVYWIRVPALSAR